jgi:hypothetical protein
MLGHAELIRFQHTAGQGIVRRRNDLCKKHGKKGKTTAKKTVRRQLNSLGPKLGEIQRETARSTVALNACTDLDVVHAHSSTILQSKVSFLSV